MKQMAGIDTSSSIEVELVAVHLYCCLGVLVLGLGHFGSFSVLSRDIIGQDIDFYIALAQIGLDSG